MKKIYLIILCILALSNTSYATNYYDDFESYTTGDLNGQGDWTGSTLVDVQNTVYKFGTQAVSITSDPTTNGAANCAISVAPSDDGLYSFYMRDTAVATTGQYLATVYIYEGANIVTGICFARPVIGDTAGFFHLKSGAWERIANYSADTWYKISIDFPTTSTHRIWINDVLKTLTTNSNFTNISSNPDSVKIVRHSAGVAGTSYFDKLIVQSSTMPLLNSFTIGQFTTGLTQPITMTAQGSNLNYLVTESATTPATDDAGWSGTAPTSYTTDSVGAKTLYAWAMNTSTSEISYPLHIDHTFYEGSSEYKNLVNSMPGDYYASNPIIEHQTATWKATQVHFPFVLVNPWDATELLMYYGGGDSASPNYSIGVATAATSNLYSWTEYGSNPVISPPAGTNYTVGPSFVYYNSTEDTIWVYSPITDIGATPLGWMGLWKSDSEDPYTFTYYGAVISPSGDETKVGDSGMIIDAGTWYCYYGYRTATSTLEGLRLATSSDGVTWNKPSSDSIISLGPSGSYDDKYIESGQAFKIGSSYVVGYTCYNGTDNCDGLWTMAYSVSDDPEGPFYKDAGNPVFEAGPAGAWDDTHVSTNFNFQYGSNYYFFYQGTGANGSSPDCYNASLWDMGMTTVKISTYTPQIIIY